VDRKGEKLIDLLKLSIDNNLKENKEEFKDESKFI
jgi:hypothetical protein